MYQSNIYIPRQPWSVLSCIYTSAYCPWSDKNCLLDLCGSQLFKGVAERGKWTRVLEDAERSYMDGDLDSALMVYLLLAEMGLEVAQTNAAYILEQGLWLSWCMQLCVAESCSCTDGVTLVQEKETLKRALILWNRAASQGVCVHMQLWLSYSQCYLTNSCQGYILRKIDTCITHYS